MILQTFLSRPRLYQVLMGVCVAVEVTLILSALRALNHPPPRPVPMIMVLVFPGICAGFYLLRSWAWGSLAVIILFSLINVLHGLISMRISFRLLSLPSLLISLLILTALNTNTVRTLFRIPLASSRRSPGDLFNFAVICLAVGGFIIVEILGVSPDHGYSTPATLFLGFLGGLYLLLGFGLWQGNQNALQGTLSILVFTVIAVAIMSGVDLVRSDRYGALQTFLFYIGISIGMLIYWIGRARPRG